MENSIIQCPQTEKNAHAGIYNSIITTLPNFQTATIDELLDIRKELARPLTNFRSAIFEYSSTVKNNQWDKDFGYDCMKLYNMVVLPKVQELEELSKDNAIIKNIYRYLIKDASF